jgi:ribosome-binding factor A
VETTAVEAFAGIADSGCVPPFRICYCARAKSRLLPLHSDILKRLFRFLGSSQWERLKEQSMPEQRGRKYHQERVAETLREEIGAMIEGELSDPRISFAYVSQVVLNPGGKSALVYIAVDGGAEEEAQTLDGLMAARGYIRHELLERMGVRFVPELTFHIDRSEKMKARIDDLLGRKRRTSVRTQSAETNNR